MPIPSFSKKFSNFGKVLELVIPANEPEVFPSCEESLTSDSYDLALSNSWTALTPAPLASSLWINASTSALASVSASSSGRDLEVQSAFVPVAITGLLQAGVSTLAFYWFSRGKEEGEVTLHLQTVSQAPSPSYEIHLQPDGQEAWQIIQVEAHSERHGTLETSWAALELVEGGQPGLYQITRQGPNERVVEFQLSLGQGEAGEVVLLDGAAQASSQPLAKPAVTARRVVAVERRVVGTVPPKHPAYDSGKIIHHEILLNNGDFIRVRTQMYGKIDEVLGVEVYTLDEGGRYQPVAEHGFVVRHLAGGLLQVATQDYRLNIPRDHPSRDYVRSPFARDPKDYDLSSKIPLEVRSALRRQARAEEERNERLREILINFMGHRPDLAPLFDERLSGLELEKKTIGLDPSYENRAEGIVIEMNPDTGTPLLVHVGEDETTQFTYRAEPSEYSPKIGTGVAEIYVFFQQPFQGVWHLDWRYGHLKVKELTTPAYRLWHSLEHGLLLEAQPALGSGMDLGQLRERLQAEISLLSPEARETLTNQIFADHLEPFANLGLGDDAQTLAKLHLALFGSEAIDLEVLPESLEALAYGPEETPLHEELKELIRLPHGAGLVKLLLAGLIEEHWTAEDLRSFFKAVPTSIHYSSQHRLFDLAGSLIADLYTRELESGFDFPAWAESLGFSWETFFEGEMERILSDPYLERLLPEDSQALENIRANLRQGDLDQQRDVLYFLLRSQEDWARLETYHPWLRDVFGVLASQVWAEEELAQALPRGEDWRPHQTPTQSFKNFFSALGVFPVHGWRSTLAQALEVFNDPLIQPTLLDNLSQAHVWTLDPQQEQTWFYDSMELRLGEIPTLEVEGEVYTLDVVERQMEGEVLRVLRPSEGPLRAMVLVEWDGQVFCANATDSLELILGAAGELSLLPVGLSDRERQIALRARLHALEGRGLDLQEGHLENLAQAFFEDPIGLERYETLVNFLNLVDSPRANERALAASAYRIIEATLRGELQDWAYFDFMQAWGVLPPSSDWLARLDRALLQARDGAPFNDEGFLETLQRLRLAVEGDFSSEMDAEQRERLSQLRNGRDYLEYLLQESSLRHYESGTLPTWRQHLSAVLDRAEVLSPEEAARYLELLIGNSLEWDHDHAGALPSLEQSFLDLVQARERLDQEDLGRAEAIRRELRGRLREDRPSRGSLRREFRR
ncbi:MAG: hypothetical protein KDK66_00175 [Deltaproteobacteria bacterium]|nr:hypothetical protein [Deltaproteobacteria bacterium]